MTGHGVRLGEPHTDGGVVLAEQWRRRVLSPVCIPAGPGVAVIAAEPQVRTWKLDAAEEGMLHCDHQALRAGLLPVIDLVDGADRAHGHAGVTEQPKPVPAARPCKT